MLKSRCTGPCRRKYFLAPNRGSSSWEATNCGITPTTPWPRSLESNANKRCICRVSQEYCGNCKRYRCISGFYSPPTSTRDPIEHCESVHLVSLDLPTRPRPNGTQVEKGCLTLSATSKLKQVWSGLVCCLPLGVLLMHQAGRQAFLTTAPTTG